MFFIQWLSSWVIQRSRHVKTCSGCQECGILQAGLASKNRQSCNRQTNRHFTLLFRKFNNKSHGKWMRSGWPCEIVRFRWKWHSNYQSPLGTLCCLLFLRAATVLKNKFRDRSFFVQLVSLRLRWDSTVNICIPVNLIYLIAYSVDARLGWLTWLMINPQEFELPQHH